MKLGRQFLPSRQQVIYGYTHRLLNETAMNANSFAMQVAENYFAMTAPHMRDKKAVPLRMGHGDDLADALKANGQALRRYMDGTVKTLPADLEDAWVLSLPEPYRTAAVKDRRALQLSVDDTPALRISQLMARARALHAKKPIRLLVVDHIHDFKIDAKLARFEYGEIAQGLKTLAKEFNCPVLALGQLNRALSNRQDKRPNMADLRESGEIEQKADMIIFIHRDEYYDKNTHMKGIVELILAKGRDVEAGKSIFLRNDYAHMALRDREGDLPEPPEPDRPASRAGGKPKFFGGARRGAFGDQD